MTSAEDCLAGGGQMGALMRGVDWSATPFGPVASWPQSLRTALSMMLESRVAMAVAWGPELRCFYNDRYQPLLNDRYQPLLGAKHPLALGAPGAAIFPELWHLLGPELERVRRGEAVVLDDRLLPLERNGYREDGWFSISYSPIRDESGGIGGILAVVVETTGRVESERRLATLRELAASAAEARSAEQACASAALAFARNPIDVPFAVLYALDEDGRTARRLARHGIPDDLAAAAPALVDLTAPESPHGWPLARVSRGLDAEVLSDLPRRFGELPGGPGSEPARSAILLPLWRPGLAHPYGVLVTGISPRRALDDRYRGFFELAAEHLATALETARRLEAQRRRALALAELLSRAPIPICILRGPHFAIELANARCCEVLRRSHDEVIGRPLFAAVPELESQVFRELLEGVRATGEPYVGKEVPAIFRGAPAFFNFVYSPMRDLDGAVDGILVIATEVTEEVKARDEMARAVAYNERFTAILGHDLRNPLNAIMTIAQQIQRRSSSDALALPAARILKSGQRMLCMINQLLDLARVRVTGGLLLRPRQLDLADLCRQVLDELRAAHPDSSLELVTAGDLVGRWDGDRLAQVLSNLSANALQHGRPATPVYVRLDGRDPAHVDIRVENQGAIPEPVLPILFDPFRATHYRGANPGGLGLGLYISQEIVAAHRGRIQVRSTPADGTCFQIELPKAAAAAP